MAIIHASTPNFDKKRILFGLFNLRTVVCTVVATDCVLSISLALSAFWASQLVPFYLHLVEAFICGGVVYAVIKCRPKWIIGYLVYSIVDIAYTSLVFIPKLMVDNYSTYRGDALRKFLTGSLILQNVYLSMVITGWLTVLLAYKELAKDAKENDGNANYGNNIGIGATGKKSSSGNNISTPFKSNALGNVSSTVSTITLPGSETP